MNLMEQQFVWCRKKYFCVLALCGRWGKLEHELNGYIDRLADPEKRYAREMIGRFSAYVKELQAVLTGTATTQSIIQAFGSGF